MKKKMRPFRLFLSCMSLASVLCTSILAASSPPPETAPTETVTTSHNIELTANDVLMKLAEAFSHHFQYKKIDGQIAQRTAHLFVKQIDPLKSLFIEEEITPWISVDSEKNKLFWSRQAKKWQKGDFTDFYTLVEKAQKAHQRKEKWLYQLNRSSKLTELSKKPQKLPSSAELAQLPWCRNEKQLIERIEALFSLNYQINAHLFPSRTPQQHLEKAIAMQKEREAEVLPPKLKHKTHILILKSFLNAFDPHSSYFTHEEAAKFLQDVNRKFSGIGVHLREELEGYRIVSILPDTPAQSSDLREGEFIVAVDGESVLELDIVKGVEKIQGLPGTPVVLTIASKETTQSNANNSIEEAQHDTGENKATHLRDITIYRQEIALQEQRFNAHLYSATAPKNGELDPLAVEEPIISRKKDPITAAPEIHKSSSKILHLQLHSFYSDHSARAAADLKREIESILANHQEIGELEAIILDLRYNVGGSMLEAINVSSLFLNPGVVVASKDHNGVIHKERALNISPIWEGPLVVLVNSKSASSSEIVTGALKDYGRALIVGDPQTYGKGSFQLFTSSGDPKGALAVTQGTYYTVSGHSPQLHGITPHIIAAGRFGPVKDGEAQTLYPLPASSIAPMYDDQLEDVSFFARQYMRSWYFKKRQDKLEDLDAFLPVLREKSHARLQKWPENKILENDLPTIFEVEANKEDLNFDALQLQEALHLTRDLLQLRAENPVKASCSMELLQEAS